MNVNFFACSVPVNRNYPWCPTCQKKMKKLRQKIPKHRGFYAWKQFMQAHHCEWFNRYYFWQDVGSKFIQQCEKTQAIHDWTKFTIHIPSDVKDSNFVQRLFLKRKILVI